MKGRKNSSKEQSPSKSEMQETLRDLKESCYDWTECTGMLMQNSMQCQIRIVLHNGALTQAFLEITDSEGSTGIFPLNRSIMASFNTCTICFTFTHVTDFPNGDPLLVFLVTDSLKLEVLVSQIRLCAGICSIANDTVEEMNIAFLRKSASDKCLLNGLKLTDVFETNCALSPVNRFPAAYKTWAMRTHFLNASYFTTTTPLRVACLTWNVGCGKPTADVVHLLRSVMEGEPDILFFAFQEIDMRLKSVVTGNSSLAAEWEKMIIESIEGSSEMYEIGGSRSLGGVYACVAHRKGLTLPVEVSEPKILRLGAGGMTANKGGVIITAKIGGHSKFTFIGCHLAAHAEREGERNKEMLRLVSRAPKDTDYVILIGDLNYRLNLTYEEAMEMIEKGDVQELLAHDQLRLAREQNRKIARMREAEIKFFPSYKFDKGNDVYDTGPKHRTPSYTDRILVKTNRAHLAVGAATSFLFETDLVRHVMPRIEGFTTESCFTVDPHEPTFPRRPQVSVYDRLSSTFSDHRPVTCQMTFNVPVEVPEKLAEFEQFRKKKLEEMEHLSIPKVAMPMKATIAVGDSAMIPIMNTSVAWARWTHQIIGEGVKVVPKQGVIIPGVTIQVTVTVEKLSPTPVMVIFSDKGTLGVLEVTTIEPRKTSRVVRDS